MVATAVDVAAVVEIKNIFQCFCFETLIGREGSEVADAQRSHPGTNIIKLFTSVIYKVS
jgi:hypothetical protein